MHKHLAAVLSLPLALVALSACGSSSTSSSTPSGSTATEAPSVATSTVAPGGGASASVQTPVGDSPTPSATTGGTATADGTASAGDTPSVAASASGTATSPAAGASAATSSKRFATAKLPTKVDGYTGAVQKQGAGQSGMYTGASQDDMLMVQLNPISATGALTRLTNAQAVGVARCGGSSDAAGVMTCVVALDGGSLVVQGTDTSTAAQLGKVTNAIVATFA